MSEKERKEEIWPYLNPEYWNGHSLGYGEITGEWPNPYPLMRSSQLRRSGKALKKRLERMSRAICLETFNPGDEFDANQYAENTIVMYQTESLIGEPKSIADPKDLETLPPPNSPIDSLSFTGEDNTFYYSEGLDSENNISYSSRTKWGIVRKNSSYEHELHTVPAGLIHGIGSDRVFIASPLLVQKSPIQIGVTNHYLSRGREMVERINILDVVAYGQTEREKSGIGLFVMKLVLGKHST